MTQPIVERFECQKCGNCCKDSRIDILCSDILRWEKQRRWDILCEVSWIINPKTGGHQLAFYKTVPKESLCPFLSKNSNLCTIHDTKPQVCRDFPICGTEKKLRQCKGIGLGPKINPVLISLVENWQFQDLAEVYRFQGKVSSILLLARFLWGGIRRGYLRFDEKKGKYVTTPKGQRVMEIEFGKLKKKVKEQGKTPKEIAQEIFLKIQKPRLLDGKLIESWKKGRQK